jgi:hypothetical protein
MVTFLLAQPFAEDIERITNNWKNETSNVLLWKWPETLFGVFISGGPKLGMDTEEEQTQTFRRTFRVTTDARKAHIPVYFDFEGSWSRFTGQEGTLAYPHALPGRISGEEVPPTLSDDQRAKIAELTSKPFKNMVDTEHPRFSSLFLPRSQRKLIEGGIVEKKTLLDLANLLPYHGHRIEHVAFIQGELVQGASPGSLFRVLMAIHVMPFLFVSDGRNVLMAGLSPAPSPYQYSTGNRPAVLENLQRFMREIEIQREPIETLSVMVDHRYDRLFPSVA